MSPVTLFLCGDVMLGRGIDQIMPRSCDPRLGEPVVRDARRYVALAEDRNGPIPRAVAPDYVWGEAREELDRVAPDVRIVNLETSVTCSDARWRGKDVSYRMHPENVRCLTAARIDICSLANNHVLDYGFDGLADTLDTLHRAGVSTAGAGRDLEEARRPASVPLRGGGRLLVFACGTASSGVLPQWAAGAGRPGVDLLEDLSRRTADRVVERALQAKRPGDLAVVSIHWGDNWGYAVPRQQVAFAHRLLDGGVDLVHGHSSHHPRPLETYRGRLILYGCGDFINDYEGIGGYEEFRGDLVLMYFATLRPESGQLVSLRMTPMRMRRFRLNRVSADDARWLRDTLDRFGTPVHLEDDGSLSLLVTASDPCGARGVGPAGSRGPAGA